jgi:hypothetical protein
MPRRRDPISQLETAIECLPRATREAMLEGIRTRPIIAGAYTDNRGGICPMLAAHRGGGRTSLLSFARSWDAFARAKRARRATRRELRVLEDLLVASLASEVDLGVAIAAHRASAAGRAEVVDEPQQAPPAGLDAVEPGYVAVEQGDLRVILDDGFEGPFTVARLTQPAAGDGLERGGDLPPSEGVLVDDQDRPAHASPSRMRTNAASGSES